MENQHLVVYDATRTPSLLDEGWGFGAFSMWLRGRTTGMLGALNWTEVIEWLRIRSLTTGKIKEVQFWGHGTPGQAYIDGERFTDSLSEPAWRQVMSPDALFWFRTCSTFQGKRGREFAVNVSNLLGCRVAAHTFKIGLRHSGLHSIEPSEMPKWPEGEGVNEKGELEWSGFFKPNTIMFWNNRIPEGW